MIERESRPRLWPRSIWLGVFTTSLVACARSTPSSLPARAHVASVADRTVFTDSSLFGRICMEADSGLTRTIGRCTPRDQGVRIR